MYISCSLKIIQHNFTEDLELLILPFFPMQIHASRMCRIIRRFKVNVCS